MIIIWKPRKYKTYYTIENSFTWIGGLTTPPTILNYVYEASLKATRKYKTILEAKH